jgi:hypothetical protein
MDEIKLGDSQGIEVVFLALATVYSFILPLKATLSILDMVILVTIFGLYAWRLQAAAGLGAFVSSKVNQWTLLVGTIPVVYSLGAGQIDQLQLSTLQQDELLLTSAQSFFAIAVISKLRMNLMESVLLAMLFIGQFVILGSHNVFIVIYMMLGVFFFIRQRRFIFAAGRAVMGDARKYRHDAMPLLRQRARIRLDRCGIHL